MAFVIRRVLTLSFFFRMIRCLRYTTVALACLFFHTAYAKPDEPLTAVADLRYGVALYHYYQGQHLEALSDLLVAKEKGGIRGHGDNPDIMAGGFYLAYGMERTASDVFERLLDENRPQKTRDAAWFYMARMRYLRQDWGGANQALDKISEEPEELLAQNMGALQVNLALKQEKPEEAEGFFNSVLEKSSWAPYLYYNLGAGYSRQAQYDKAVTYYNKLLNMKQRGDAYLALYDKAMTAAGYSFLLDKRYEEAIFQFSKVRLNSPLSNKALLGYGWANAEQEDYLSALKPWQILSQRKFIDENTQESYIAVPYAYEKLGRPGLALKYFREAEANFEAEIATLEDVISQLQGDALLDALRINLGEDVNWLNYAESNNLTPQLSYLIELFSRDDFQGLIQELRDLMLLQQNLNQWQRTMRFYSAMLDEREINRQQEMASLMQRKQEYNLGALTEQRRTFSDEISRIKATNDFFALASGEDAERVAELKRIDQELSALSASGYDVSDIRENYRRIRGQYFWQAAENYSDKLWRVEKGLKTLDDNLRKIQQVEGRVQGIIDSGFDLKPYRQRIANIQGRLGQQLTSLDATIESSKSVLRGRVELVLREQHIRLHDYLAQARLSIARLLDVATEEAF